MTGILLEATVTEELKKAAPSTVLKRQLNHLTKCLLLSTVLAYLNLGLGARAAGELSRVSILDASLTSGSPEVVRNRLDFYKGLGLSLLSFNITDIQKTLVNKPVFVRPLALPRESEFRLKISARTAIMPDSWFDTHNQAQLYDCRDLRTRRLLSVFYSDIDHVLLDNADKLFAGLGKFDILNNVDFVTIDLGPDCIANYPPQSDGSPCFWLYSSDATLDFIRKMHTKYGSLDKANSVWHTDFKSWEGLKVPMPGRVPGAMWNDVLEWYRDKKRSFINFQIENYKVQISKYCKEHPPILIIKMAGKHVTADEWNQAVQSGSGDKSVAAMCDPEFLLDTANKQGCWLQYSGNDQSEIEYLQAYMKEHGYHIPMWIDNGTNPALSLDELTAIVAQNKLFGFEYNCEDVGKQSDTKSQPLEALSVSIKNAIQKLNDSALPGPPKEETANASGDQPGAGGTKVNPAAEPQSRMADRWWADHHEDYIALARKSNPGILFIGDSIIQNWQTDGPSKYRKFKPIWDDFYGPRQPLNLGLAADSTANVLWRICNGEVDGIDPKVAVLLVGVNNSMLRGWTAEQTDGGIDAIVDELHKRLPRTKILLLGILPCECTKQVWDTNESVNRYLAAKYRRSKFVHFVDVSDLFMKNGEVDKSLYLETYDKPPRPPLHPTSVAMDKVTSRIEPDLDKLYESKR